MDSCVGVEQDLDKALTKFNSLNDHTNTVLQDIIDQVEELRKETSKRKCFLVLALRALFVHWVCCLRIFYDHDKTNFIYCNADLLKCRKL